MGFLSVRVSFLCLNVLASSILASTIPPNLSQEPQTDTAAFPQFNIEAIGSFGVVGVDSGSTNNVASPTTATTTQPPVPVVNSNNAIEGNAGLSGIEAVVTDVFAPSTQPPVANSNNDNNSSSSDTTATVAVTTVAPPPYNCYDCNSGSPLPGYWQNVNCDVTGYIAEWYTPQSCDSFCFVSVGLYPAGTVFRGCASNLWLGEEAPSEGCFQDEANQRAVCLCAGDNCNTHDLSQLSQAYAEQYTALNNVNPSLR